MRALKFRMYDEKYNTWVNAPLFVYPSTEIVKQGIVFQQFTGILDKNGKEVYEGDIIQWFRMLEATIEYPAHRAQYTSIVEYEDGKFGFVMEGFNGLFQTLCDEYDIEIIGNIFENEH